MFEKRYGQSYDWLVASEHINKPNEIMDELNARFTRKHSAFFPFLLPGVWMNLVIGLVYTK